MTEAKIGVMQPQAKTCQISQQYQVLGWAWKRFSLGQERTKPTDTLVLDVWPPEPWREYISIVSGHLVFVVLCYSSPRKLTQARTYNSE